MPPRAATMPLLLLSGEWDELWDLASVTQREGSPLERPMAVMILGHLLRNRGKPDEAWEMVREILPRGPASEPEETLFPYATETLRLATRLSIDSGEIDRAQTWLDAHDGWLNWSGASRGRAESMTLHSEILRLMGSLVDAEQAAVEAVSIASEPRQPVALIQAERTLGQILMQRGNEPAAEAHLARALELANACAIPLDQSLSEIALARLYRTQGRERDEIERLLTAARERAEYLAATPLVVEIDSLLTDPIEANGHVSLTAREREVLRMIAQGMTDAEAAEHLFISPRTVSQHMRSVYNKLGVSSRAAATRWAVQNGQG